MINSDNDTKRLNQYPLLITLLFSIAVNTASMADAPPLLMKPTTVEVINAPAPDGSIPHDNTFFTQGLVYEDGVLYESTGLYGESKLVAIDANNGDILRSRTVSDEYFAEGLALRGDELYQLTWKAGKGFIYNKHTFERLREFSYPGEGWGLAHHGEHFWLSDGTTKIRQLNQKLNDIKLISIKYNNKNIININELEWIDDKIWANIWQTNVIVIINPENGQIEKQINFDLPLRQDYHKNQDVLNGIAYDNINNKLYITGKLFNKIYIYNIRNIISNK